jgi:hypothetical protein
VHVCVTFCGKDFMHVRHDTCLESGVHPFQFFILWTVPEISQKIVFGCEFGVFLWDFM